MSLSLVNVPHEAFTLPLQTLSFEHCHHHDIPKVNRVLFVLRRGFLQRFCRFQFCRLLRLAQASKWSPKTKLIIITLRSKFLIKTIQSNR